MLGEDHANFTGSWLKAGVLGDLDKHTGAYLHALMESKRHSPGIPHVKRSVWILIVA